MKFKRRTFHFIYLLILFESGVTTNAETLEPQDCSENYCYDLDLLKEQRFMFGTKSPYPHYTDFDVNQEFKVPSK